MVCREEEKELFIKKGLLADVNIYTKGENLSLYLTGYTNLKDANSKLSVYGQLSKQITSLLGPVGNASINTLFSFIPGVKVSELDLKTKQELEKIPEFNTNLNLYRFFKANINGNINTENYVQSFKWLE